MTEPLIIGSMDDPHIVDVVHQLESGASVLDADSIGKGPFSWKDGALSHPSVCEVGNRGDHQRRGWIRRIAPASWMTGIRAESIESAVRVSWLTLLGAVLRSSEVQWLSTIDSITAAENKLVAEASARRLAIQTPRTIVTNTLAEARAAIEDDAIVKPLGPGHFIDEERAFNVFARPVDLSTLSEHALADAPFLIQERLRAQRHFRVVTVVDEAWAAQLDARQFAMDWRESDAAHGSFTAVTLPMLTDSAIALARELRLGYSSQDWIETADGLYMLDVNPSGQWLFLPSEVTAPVSRALARWLNGR